MKNITALIAGLVFGLGLTISRMVDPAVVRGFLDFAGDWNPALIFVLGGAVGVSVLNWHIRNRKKIPILGGNFPDEASTIVNNRLILGAILFGLGWGLVGLCPGPAIAGASYGGVTIWVFLLSMVIGMKMVKN